MADDPHDNDIIGAAVVGLKENELTERWAPITSVTKPGVPYKVQRLDKKRANALFYYIVPFMAGERMPLAVKVGGSPLKFQQAIAAQTSEQDVISIISPQEARERAIEVNLDFEDGMRIRTTKDNVPEQIPILAWEPCLESFSPFWPFYLITIIDEEHVQRTIFSRAFDGIPLASLRYAGGA